MSLEDYIKNLSPEQQEKARACGSIGELLDLAKEEGVPIPDETLQAIAGGADPNAQNCSGEKCPKCGSSNVTCTGEKMGPGYLIFYFTCNNCGNKFEDKSYG